MHKNILFHYMFFTIFMMQLSACTSAQSIYPDKTFYIRLPSHFKLVSTSATITNEPSHNGEFIHKIKFEQVRGGETKLFGMVKISESDAFKAKRLTVLNGQKEVMRLSINDLSEYLQDTISLNF